MHGMMRIFSNFKEFYNDINGATLTGAIDVVVVEQPDGTYNCSPFHVRFGKLGVLRSKEKVVDIEINGEALDIHMKLGESGEAFFVEELEDDDENDIPEHLATSPIPVSEIENIFKTQGRRRSFHLDDIDLNNQPNSYEKRRHTADNQMANRAHLERDFLKRQIGLGNIDGVSAEDVTLSLTTASRRSDEEDLSRSQNDVSETIFKMDSLDEPVSKIENEKQQDAVAADKVPIKTPEDPPSDSKNSKKKRKKMRKKNSTRKSLSNNFLTSPTSETAEKTNGSTTDRSSLDSNCSEPELKDLSIKVEKIEKDPVPTQSDATNIKMVEADFHFFSDTELTSGIAESRSSSPTNIESVQSDSEIEMKLRIKEQSNEPAKSWEWGGFPNVTPTTSPTSEVPTKEEQKSMLSNMFSFMKSKHNAQSRYEEGGVYLSEITSGGIDQEVAEIYFSQTKAKNVEDIDMDCESGNGPSLTQSPNSAEGCKSIDSDFDEQTKMVQTYSQDVALSLCGWDPLLTQDRFNEHLISFTDFCNNPSLLDSPKLVAKINNKYYSWKVAAPMLITIICFGRPLVQSCVDDLCNTFMPLQDTKDKPIESQTHKSSWWHWRSRSSREATPAKDDPKLKLLTPEKTVEAVLEPKTESPVTENTKELEIEEKKEEQERPELIKVSPDKCRKTLRLSSKQISSLNLREGMNEVEFSVTTAYQGTTRCQCHLYKWKWDDKIVISDIDGTITKSDVLGHILPIVGKDWAQSGVAHLFNKIKDNGYKLLYLSARAIGQARITREYLKSIKQGDMSMPDGPILLNPTSLITAFHREVIEKKPEAFKISCMSDIKALFPSDSEPFYAGYGNRINDVWAYRAVGIPIHRIFTINPKGELKHELTQTFQSSYTNMSVIVDQMFPSRLEPANDYSQFSYWREPITVMETLPEVA
ncbi:phosphatidate phosphatase LPIN3 [Sitophilus oryzae]|uniref:phosphatidate phosphatase n=1 Tax=Sitophilus oryzae TaxID=7048 RepID=A0A6J2YC93_SITOR|nr:phosphatidate phosphatase LPIN3 [Sitophilus oryzae]